MGFFKKFKEAWLASMTFDKLDDEFYEELEEALILADIGASTAADTVVQLRKRVSQKLLTRADEVKDALRDILAEKLDVGDTALRVDTQPSVVLIIGVNGVGKTTSIGKLAARLKGEGKKVLLCAGDTFRAAAADQLEIWANRAGVPIVRQHEGADPGAVLFDALQAARARDVAARAGSVAAAAARAAARCRASHGPSRPKARSGKARRSLAGGGYGVIFGCAGMARTFPGRAWPAGFPV